MRKKNYKDKHMDRNEFFQTFVDANALPSRNEADSILYEPVLPPGHVWADYVQPNRPNRKRKYGQQRITNE